MVVSNISNSDKLENKSENKYIYFAKKESLEMLEETPENGTGSEVPEIELIIKVSGYPYLIMVEKKQGVSVFFFLFA